MKAFIIDPLKVGTQVVTTLELVDTPSEAARLFWIRELLGLSPDDQIEELQVGSLGTTFRASLYIAGPAHFEIVRPLGEFRFRKPDGSHRSVAGRGVILSPYTSLTALDSADVLNLLVYTGQWRDAA